MSASLVIYGKGRVGSAVARLADAVGIAHRTIDDSDADFVLAPGEIVIPSPGVPPTNRAFSKPERMLAELDFAAAFLPKGAKLVGITGTDGKSTTTWMIYEMLRKEYGDTRVFLSGNFELALSETVREILEKWVKYPIIVVEISSFMAYLVGRPQTEKLLAELTETQKIDAEKSLKKSEGIHFATSVFTNLETDHQNWHPNMADYLDAKLRVMRASDTSLVNSQVLEKAHSLRVKADFGKSKVRVFEMNLAGLSTATDSLKNRAQTKDQTPQRDRTDGENIIISGRQKYKLSETKFTGPHNAMNLLATGLVGNTLKICSKRTKKYFQEISWLSHRFESIGKFGEVEYIDDSKATSAQALGAALGAFSKPKAILIAGGSDKGDSFTSLAPLFAQSVKYAVFIGATREKVAEAAIEAKVPYTFAETMDEAVRLAVAQAKKGDSVLLSPGCASFGLFKDYLDRAHQFRDGVKKYAK